jgi:hypothetical protein
MFDSENSELKDYIETTSRLNISSVIIAEWNMNNPDNLYKIGNFRYRPTESSSAYKTLESTFSYSATESPAITDSTYSDVKIDGGLDNDDVPLTFTSVREKERLLYSLEDCFSRFRPRSGINKLRYFSDRYSHFDNSDMSERPRYYMAHKNDTFKYWTSYRVEDGIERGISKSVSGKNIIDDTVPFVIYKNEIPANRVVLKMQTNIGSIDLGPFYNNAGSYTDPFYGNSNKTVPQKWTLQYLEKTKNAQNQDIFTWKDAYSVDDSSVISTDGYLELAYDVIVPSEYADIFKKVGTFSAKESLPNTPAIGSAFLITSSETDLGSYYVYTGDTGSAAYNGYNSFVPQYGWFKKPEILSNLMGVATELVNTPSYFDAATSKTKYREFLKICGLRVIVETMSKDDCSFDLLELSPRLSVDLSDKTTTYSIKKTASDLGSTGLPVGQLLSSTGSISLLDYDNAFNENNTDSILSNYTLSKNIQIKFFEAILDVPIYDENNLVVQNLDYYVPIKTMYADGFPDIDKETRAISIPLRDMFFYFESTLAPQILVQNVSVSYAVSLLLDSIGFSNYTFKRNDGETETIIPFFFVSPDKSVAQILQDIAVSTQTAMFFDEYNNFVLMSKNYIMPTEDERATDLVLRGTVDYEKDGVYKNKTTTASNSKLANIIAISSATNNIFNDGVIAYNARYIQKTYGSIRQASLIDQDQTWIYKPVLLWEVAGTEKTKSQNDNVGNQSSYTLSAIPLNTTLTTDLPTVVSISGPPKIINNTVNFGEGIYWISRYNGYFFANGEIIKYDAVEYNIPGYGNKWISSSEEYSNYFSKIPFNGKLYPTGLVRIFSEPNYQKLNNGTTIMKVGAVAKHGRGQFGTTVTNHQAGLDPYWTNKTTTAPVKGIKMDSKYLFGKNADFNLSNIYTEVANKGSFSIYNKDITTISGSVTTGNTLLQSTNHGLAVGEKIYFSTAPTGTTVNTTIYYVKSVPSDNSFSISTSNGGEEIKFTTSESFVAKKNNVSINISSSTFTSTDHRLNNGELVAFSTSGTLPTGINTDTVYYVKDKTTNTFKLALTSEGAAISLSGTQTNLHTVRQLFDGKIQPNINNLSGTITIANPGIVEKTSHGLSYNDKVGFATTGKLPTGIIANTEYYVKGVLSLNSFTLGSSTDSKSVSTSGIARASQSSVSIAPNGVVTATSHELAVNDEIYFSAGTLPTQITVNTIYYVRSVSNDNTFVITSTPGGDIIPTTGNQSGLTLQKSLTFTSNSHGFIVGDSVTLTRATPSDAMPGSFLTTSVYYVKSKDTNTFTLSRKNGGGKITMTDITFSGSSVLQVSKNLVISGKAEGNIQLIKYVVPNSSTNKFRLPKHGFSAGDKISFSVSAGGALPTNIVAGTIYFVIATDLSTDEFKVSAASGDSAISLSGTSTGKILITSYATMDIAANTINQPNSGLSSGDRIVFSTSGTLPTGITLNKIYYVISASNPTFKISTVLGGSEIDISGSETNGNHTITKINDTTVFKTTIENRLEVNKKINFTSTGSLPSNMNTSNSYYTKRILDRQTFTISDSWTNFNVSSPTDYFGPNSTFGAVGTLSGNGEVILSISDNTTDVTNGSTSNQILNSSIVVSDSSRIQIGYYVEIYQGTGETTSNNTRVVSIVNNQYGTDTIVVSPALKQPILKEYTDPVNGDYVTSIIRVVNRSPAAPSTTLGKAGVSDENNTLARKAARTGVIKNFMTNSTITETDANNLLSTQTGTIQSSAFIFNGPPSGSFPVGDSNTASVEPIDFISYIYKPLTDKFSHFGTRMRIIGRIDGTQDKQSPAGSSVYYSVTQGTQIDKNITVSGGSGGIGIMLNPETNNGYYLELIGLTQNNVNQYFSKEEFHNIIFYKTVRRNVDMATIFSVSRINKVVTVTTTNEHEFTVGDLVTIKGVDNGTTRTNFNGSFKITAITPSTFTYSITDSASQSSSGFTGGMAYIQENAIPVKLWGGTTQIVVDDGTFVGQARTVAETSPSVYDIAVEYKDVDSSTNGKSRQFYIYLNGKLIATVSDHDPLPIYNNMAMFVRGSARCMFENIYAVANNYAENTSSKIDTPGLSTVFGTSEITVNDSFKKYAMNGLVQSTYLSGISPASPPQYNIYFEEFGTIMREAAHFNIKYDKAYPALYAKLSPTFNSIKGYSVAGFMAGAYGAEFLIFNNTDTVLSLDDTSGNYLRIQGATFTQQSEHNYTVDDHFKHTGDFSNIEIGQGSDISSYDKSKQNYQDIKNSRLSYGKNQFSLNAPYIQDHDSAQELMSWMISKILKPRKSIGLKVFGLPTAQLGDIVEIDYKANDNDINQVAADGSRFVVYDIEYTRSINGPDIILYLSEVK